jgi:TolA-binding protein
METTADAAYGVERAAVVAASAQVAALAALASERPRAPAVDAPGERAAPPDVPNAAQARSGVAAAGTGASASASASPTPEGRASTLASETALIDAARAALNRGDPGRALALLGQHGEEFSGGVLAQEAEILRIHALFARGDRTSAAEHARRFLSRNPNSPHAERLRRIAEGGARDIP